MNTNMYTDLIIPICHFEKYTPIHTIAYQQTISTTLLCTAKQRKTPKEPAHIIVMMLPSEQSMLTKRRTSSFLWHILESSPTLYL